MSEIDISELKASLRRDNEALRDIFDACSAYCMKSLMKYHNCSRSDANDLFIDALLIFRDKILDDQLEYLTNPRQYLLGVCIVLNKKRLRLQGNQNKLGLVFTSDDLVASSYEEQVIDREISYEQQRKVMHSFKQLGDACREILTLFYVDHFSMKEIAHKMSFASSDVVKTKKMRCLKKWREIFRENNGSNG